ncbi:MAG: hypothetical protein J1F65_06345 [Clostridiales bacterium]|nr:hypothetical protein [Clostridiales bacterium]
MDDIEFVSMKTADIFKKYNIKEERYKSRYEALLNDINNYIKASKLDKTQVVLNKYSLSCMLVDFFMDIGRLKEFHHIDRINSIKIVSYISYWFLRRKPIQVLSDEDSLLYINEKFITLYILDFLMNDERGNILDREEKGLVAFREQLCYYLKYRHFDAQSIEMILMSFFAGQIYENLEEDLSDKLPKSEN